MIFSAIEHERRSRQVADSLRNMLIGLNTGGIAVTLAAASKLFDAPHDISPRWAACPIFIFVLSLALIAVSMMFAKKRELDRRKVAAQGNVRDERPQVEDVPMQLRSIVLDGIALVLFLVGFTIALHRVSTLIA